MVKETGYDRKRIGVMIQTKRSALGYTQESLAEAAECSARMIASIESGTVGMSIAMLLKLCRLLHTTPNEILLGEAPDDETKWLCDWLNDLEPQERQTAIAIVRPYLESLSK